MSKSLPNPPGRMYGDPTRHGLDAYSRHKKLVDDYLRYYQQAGDVLPAEAERASYKSDVDVLRENWRFVRNAADDAQASWEQRVAKQYYDRLYKEYCLADLKHYKSGQVGLRWRVEKEVLDGKGQFTCGSLRCDNRTDLKSWEVNFGYVEAGEKRNALVKLRLCPDCSAKLNYRKKAREAGSSAVAAANAAVALSDRPAGSSDDAGAVTVKRARLAASGEGGNTHEASEAETERSHWKGSAAAVAVDRTREEEYEDYFADLFK